MVQSEKIYTVLKYIGGFLLCTVCFCLIGGFWETLGQDHPEDYTDCFKLQNGYIIGEASFDADHVYCNYPQVCACVLNSSYILAFYLLAPLVIVLYELLRRKIIPKRYRFLCVVGEIITWSSLYYLTLNSNFDWMIRLEYTCKFMAPLAIITLLLNCLSSKDFKVLSIIVGIVYVLLLGTFVILIIPNFFR